MELLFSHTDPDAIVRFYTISFTVLAGGIVVTLIQCFRIVNRFPRLSQKA